MYKRSYPIFILIPLLLSLGFTRQRFQVTINTAWNLSSDRVTNRAAWDSILKIGSIWFFALIVCSMYFVKIRRSPSPFTHVKLTCIAWGAGFLMLAGSIIAIIVYVDPTGMFNSHHYRPLLGRTENRDKASASYTAFSGTPQLVILGSSRAMSLSVSYIEQRTGYSAINMAVDDGRIDEFVLQASYMLAQRDHLLPQILFVEITPPLSLSNSTVNRTPYRVMPYLSWRNKLRYFQVRVEALLNRDQLIGALYVIRYYQVFGPPAPGPLNVDQPQELDAAVDFYINNNPNPGTCAELDQQGLDYLDELVSLVDEHNSSVVFYLSPVHPRYYDARMRENSGYLQCKGLLDSYLNHLAETHNNVFYLDFLVPSSINAATDENGFIDAWHLTSTNSDRLIDAAAPTLDQAYTVATQRRAEH